MYQSGWSLSKIASQPLTANNALQHSLQDCVADRYTGYVLLEPFKQCFENIPGSSRNLAWYGWCSAVQGIESLIKYLTHQQLCTEYPNGTPAVGLGTHMIVTCSHQLHGTSCRQGLPLKYMDRYVGIVGDFAEKMVKRVCTQMTCYTTTHVLD